MRAGRGFVAALAGAAAILSACTSAPETPQAAADPAAMCHALFDTDADIQQGLASKGSDGDVLCACFASEHAALDAVGQADMLALSAKLIEVRDAKDLATVEEAVELMEEDRDGAEYGFATDRLKAGGEPIEEAILRAERNPAGCAAP